MNVCSIVGLSNITSTYWNVSNILASPIVRAYASVRGIATEIVNSTNINSTSINSTYGGVDDLSVMNLTVSGTLIAPNFNMGSISTLVVGEAPIGTSAHNGYAAFSHKNYNS